MYSGDLCCINKISNHRAHREHREKKRVFLTSVLSVCSVVDFIDLCNEAYSYGKTFYGLNFA
jgi:hypothetical protein